MPTFFQDIGRNTREYATVEIEAADATEARAKLAAALELDKIDYPELFANLSWRCGETIDGAEAVGDLTDEEGEAV